MKGGSFAHFYRSYVIEPNLERAGLFELISARYRCQTALYPGCFIHITPSFYLPHVVYVDKSEDSARLWANMNEVTAYIASRKRYNRSSYVRFFTQDFAEPIPVQESSFDLLIALYAGGISRACKRYLKRGGIILSNNHHEDAGDASRDPDLQLVAVVHQKRESFTLQESDLDQYFIPARSDSRSGNSPTYAGNADYYIFKRLS